MLLIAVFAIHLRWLPSGGWRWGPDVLRYAILPVLALGSVQASILTRYVRSAVLEIKAEDFLRTARSKGLTANAALIRHGLKNASVPVLTVVGVQLAGLLVGAVVVERVFAIPGLGSYLVDAVANRDLLAVQSIVLLLVLAVVVINFLVDVAYTSIDPASEGLMSTTSLTARPEPGTAPEASVRERRARRERRPLEPGLVIGGALILLVALTALVSLIWTPYDPTLAVASDRLQPPSPAHWMGTDRYGRDVLSQVMAGAQITMLVGTIAVAIGLVIGAPLGILAGMRPKRAGVLVMGGSDVLMAFPGLLLAIVFGAIFGGGTVTAMIALGIGSAPAFARVARAGTMQVMSMDYVFAAKAANRPRSPSPCGTCCRTSAGC